MFQKNKIDKLLKKLITSLMNKNICTLDEIISQSTEINLLNLKIKSKFDLIDLIQNEELIFTMSEVISIVQLNNKNIQIWLENSISNSDGTTSEDNWKVEIIYEANQLLISRISDQSSIIDSID